MTFSQQDGAQKLIQLLARLEIPDQHDLAGESGDDAVSRAIEDAGQLYDFVQEARDILKNRRTAQ